VVAYQQFVALSLSQDSELRSQAAHIVAAAYVSHEGPADEEAALYAAIIGFLDDASVKVRAALAYGLLHAKNAPRMVMLTLAKDAPVIARAVVQYSPVLLDVDLMGAIKRAGAETLLAIAGRRNLSPKVAAALMGLDQRPLIEVLLGRTEVRLDEQVLGKVAGEYGDEARIRGLLLARDDLPAIVRLRLVEIVKQRLLGARIVKGAVAPERLERLMRDALDGALTRMGEEEAVSARSEYAKKLQSDQRINTRVLLHALINGRVLFFAQCISLLAQMPDGKVFSLLERGGRVALNALFAQCGMAQTLSNLLARLVMHARSADLLHDASARHFIVTAMIEELIIEHDGQIPDDLEAVFSYLDEQNMLLARLAARGVMPGFARRAPQGYTLALQNDTSAQMLVLSAA